ncbi:MAG: 23S rRNA (pseudouridine(1915)-N(3))-methyltransferase RlmH [Deltaproteobacteria bacterium]|jgi:23S rRNA (pseudouridine1915-N3)-methyltransferase|nr:23S rRNA (pseudouridine(1915)-N(3))-methyltransferase RlmH [Deltaproteobacteria bacterium]MBT4090563.1 23S rRNA (pseudouridine(1915)-N(3))-methyltransferase RlmH [Deltaproteobacteria bacterium]MBT4269299.1 23S rRNA (pseudouridine(1915)-N(3))-methyltransferase RlmH [Deltaproteobacteria bacterium]MBT4643263.1 23S rRNA (pseudouridine(1915)-N(3))-methyltransferase RlmH [Deltaproteobacteria bacterium]MBT6498548.1 23S rRNA (pseudouridine(1915)-N(3))-methyltransferase RlmH [Deltaproteobacteria bact
MRKIRVLCVGRKQETYLKSGIEIYLKKLQRYCEIEFKTIREAIYSSGTMTQWHAKEWKEIQSQLHNNSFLIVCDEKGSTLSSKAFARKLEDVALQGFSNIDFVIGGAYGLPAEVKSRANLVLSLSPMTFTHQMFRLFLVEQIYRAFTILKGEKYHH